MKALHQGKGRLRTRLENLGSAIGGRTTFLLSILYTHLPVAMTKFRPCIDLHGGQVKQIVGGTLTTDEADLKTNYVAEQPAAYFANLYKEHGLTGAHVIMLGPGNDEAAQAALSTWPGRLQIGGGITDQNAAQWLARGAEKVCSTPDPYYSTLEAVTYG